MSYADDNTPSVFENIGDILEKLLNHRLNRT